MHLIDFQQQFSLLSKYSSFGFVIHYLFLLVFNLIYYLYWFLHLQHCMTFVCWQTVENKYDGHNWVFLQFWYCSLFQKILWNVWVTISELRHSVILKRIKLLLLRQKLKLTSILKGQVRFTNSLYFNWLINPFRASSKLSLLKIQLSISFSISMVGLNLHVKCDDG